jgi:rubrerythrin
MDFSSIDNIIQYAIDKEVEAANFYAEAAKNVKLEGAKKVLEDYATEERKHQEVLEDLKNNKNRISEYKFEKIQDIKRSDYLVEMEYRADMDYVDLMRLAMKREEKANKLYLKLADATDNAEHSEFFKVLAQEELKHKVSLENLYDDYMKQHDD